MAERPQNSHLLASERRYIPPGRNGCCHRSPGNRLKSESVDTIVQPCSNAIAACWASATSFPVAPASRHSLSKMSRWSGPGPTTRAVGRSTSEDTNANDWSRVDGGSKILGLVTTRTKLDRTRTERANGSGPVAKRVIHVAYSACSGMESSTCAYIRTFTSGSSIPNQRLPCPNRVSSCCASSALVRSRSTPGRGCTPRTVTNWKGGGSDVSRRFRASSNVLAIKALTLMPRVSAARRTCFASWSSREIVVLMMHYHNKSSSVHQCCQTRYPLTPHTGLALAAEPVRLYSSSHPHLVERGRLRWGHSQHVEVRSLVEDQPVPQPGVNLNGFGEQLRPSASGLHPPVAGLEGAGDAEPALDPIGGRALQGPVVEGGPPVQAVSPGHVRLDGG